METPTAGLVLGLMVLESYLQLNWSYLLDTHTFWDKVDCYN